MATGLIGGRYEVLRSLGRGAGTEVLLCRRGSELVAVKLLRRGEGIAEEEWELQRSTFFNERAALAPVRHPGVVRLGGAADLDDDEPWFTLEYVPGETLAARIARGPVAPEEALRITRELAATLAHLHEEHRLGHRDLKPANIAFREDGSPVLLDFGIARSLRTASTAHWGTLGYSPPERVHWNHDGGIRIDPAKWDLYSLGVILHEMLVGKNPLLGRDLDEMIEAQLRRPHLDPGPVAHPAGPAVAALVRALTAREPARRPARAADVVLAIDGLGAPTSPTLAAARPVGQIAWLGLSAALSAFAVFALVLLAVGVWAYLRRDEGGDASPPAPEAAPLEAEPAAEAAPVEEEPAAEAGPAPEAPAEPQPRAQAPDPPAVAPPVPRPVAPPPAAAPAPTAPAPAAPAVTAEKVSVKAEAARAEPCTAIAAGTWQQASDACAARGQRLPAAGSPLCGSRFEFQGTAASSAIFNGVQVRLTRPDSRWASAAYHCVP